MRRDLVGDRRGSLSILSAPIRAAEISANAPGCIIALNGSATDVTVGSAEPVHQPRQYSGAGRDGMDQDQQDADLRSQTQRSAEGLAMTIKAIAPRRRRYDYILGEKGVAAVEFALLLPPLILLLMGTVQFGLVLANYVQVTNAAGVGAMTFAISRSDTTPYTDTVSAIKAAAPSLTPANLTMTFSVNGTACSTDAACNTALTNAAPSGGALTPASVTVAYPCGSMLTGYTFWSSTCQLSSTISEGVQ
jgi:Flp pilus assembly protein TadG